ncbi:MAG: bifunctional riboflavin kinase/FAD synthetase [Gammaproteobacteria bacterium]|nr:bifunctional riboflavin kinase/FAD synthetase [Gammaproteobacteria bacterium]
MQLIRGLHNLLPEHRGCVLTIGNFDGVHLGHQAVLARVNAAARSRGCAAVVLLFEPQPQEFFAGSKAPARLTNLSEKIRLLASCGIDRLLVVRFDGAFAGWTAERFVDELLHRQLGVEHLVVGDDFRFGARRQGNFELLRARGEQLGFGVEGTHSLLLAGQRVSSTAIREALVHGDLDGAAALLGRPFSLSGRVAHGFKRGRQLGFPTANIHLKRQVLPVGGVFAVTVFLADGQQVRGVANVGARPTLVGHSPLLEVHLFDFDAVLYGQRIRVAFHHHLRAEQRFASVAELQQQILADVAAARHYFGQQASACALSAATNSGN